MTGRRLESIPCGERGEIEITFRNIDNRYRLELVNRHGRCRLSEHSDWFDARFAGERAEEDGLKVKWPDQSGPPTSARVPREHVR